MASLRTTTSTSNTSSTTTTIPIIDVEAEFDSVEYYKKRLSKNGVFMAPSYFLPMIQSGSMDQFVAIIEGINQKQHELFTKFHTKTVYKRPFNSDTTTENHDGSDGQTNGSGDDKGDDNDHDGPGMKKRKTKNSTTTDASTQTNKGSTLHFIDQGASNQEDTEPGATYRLRSFYDTD